MKNLIIVGIAFIVLLVIANIYSIRKTKSEKDSNFYIQMDKQFELLSATLKKGQGLEYIGDRQSDEYDLYFLATHFLIPKVVVSHQQYVQKDLDTVLFVYRNNNDSLQNLLNTDFVRLHDFPVHDLHFVTALRKSKSH